MAGTHLVTGGRGWETGGKDSLGGEGTDTRLAAESASIAELTDHAIDAAVLTPTDAISVRSHLLGIWSSIMYQLQNVYIKRRGNIP